MTQFYFERKEGFNARIVKARIQKGKAVIELDEEECHRMFNVLAGNEFVVWIFENREQYTPHTTHLASSKEGKHTMLAIYEDEGR